jgi:hypothetical protein
MPAHESHFMKPTKGEKKGAMRLAQRIAEIGCALFGMRPRFWAALAAGAIALAILAWPASAQFGPIYLLIERIGSTTGYWTSGGGVNAEYVSWTMPAGLQYTGVVVNITAHGEGGVGTGTAYLYSAPGTSATLTSSATLVATNSVTVSNPVAFGSTTNLFLNLTLPASATPVTYFLVLVPSNANLAWDISNAPTTGTLPSGITLNPDQGSTAGVASPPSGSAWSALSPGGLLFGVFASDPPTGVPSVPALSPWWLLGTVLLLGASGVVLVRRRLDCKGRVTGAWR